LRKTAISAAGAAALMALALLTATVFVRPAASLSKKTDRIFDILDEGAYNRFVNYTGGYSIPVDKSMEADMRYADICAVLENGTTRVSVFRQRLSPDVSDASYIGYSDGFLKNETDHRLDRSDTRRLGGRKVYITVWNRDALPAVANDRNYYACMDIPLRGREVLTIFVASSAPFEDAGDYEYLAKGLEVTDRTGPSYIRRAEATEPGARTAWLFDSFFGAETGLKWGIFEPNAPDTFQTLLELEEKLNYTFPVLVSYTHVSADMERLDTLKSRLGNAGSEQRILELTLQTTAAPEGEGNMVYQVLSGVYDEYLRGYAEIVAASGQTVLFRLGNEMNGDWCPYSGYNTSRDPQVFIEFYRYIYGIFREKGADNVIWVWNPNGKSFPDFDWNNELMYYPGDEYVDVVGLTAYNTGDYYPGEKWTSFAELYDGLYYSYLQKYDKPLMITEFSSSSTGGDKLRWVEDMFDRIENYDRIKLAIWWSGADRDENGQIARSYYIDDPPELLDIFRDRLSKGMVTNNG
jgi:hypothetical protein